MRSTMTISVTYFTMKKTAPTTARTTTMTNTTHFFAGFIWKGGKNWTNFRSTNSRRRKLKRSWVNARWWNVIATPSIFGGLTISTEMNPSGNMITSKCKLTKESPWNKRNCFSPKFCMEKIIETPKRCFLAWQGYHFYLRRWKTTFCIAMITVSHAAVSLRQDNLKQKATKNKILRQNHANTKIKGLKTKSLLG